MYQATPYEDMYKYARRIRYIETYLSYKLISNWYSSLGRNKSWDTYDKSSLKDSH